ncbi:hypothetical protein [Streptomyces sp. OE57]|uniref:hypothetical protein n=1 Tax=Streptomyces lacaronensis TaxID=3379885 RepID=UPI0039B732DF
MPSKSSRELEQKLESIEDDMERVGRRQQGHFEEMTEMGQAFDYLGDNRLRQVYDAECASRQQYHGAKQISDSLRESDRQWGADYRDGLASLADVQEAHTLYTKSLGKTVEAARSHEHNMRAHEKVQKKRVETTRDNILTEEERQQQMEKQAWLALHAQEHQPGFDNSHRPGGPSSSRGHDPNSRGHGKNKKRHHR